MSSSRIIIAAALAGAGLSGLAACDSDGTSSLNEGPPTLSVYLTDAPGDVESVWIDVERIYFQGGPEGPADVLTEPTGLIQLTELVGTTRTLVTDLGVEPGTYRQLRFVLSAAVLETTEGDVYAFGGAEHPGGLEATGDLQCPGCGASGLKVKLAGDALEVSEGGTGVVLDFDVSQSFGRMAGNSGRWVMRPVIHAVRTEGGDDPDAPSASGAIRGAVVLADDGQEGTVSLPQCPEGTDRSLSDFVPVAEAATLIDEDGGAIRRTGQVDTDGTFVIAPLEADGYALAHEAETVFDAFKLVWEASVEPAQVSVNAVTDAEGVVYTVSGATCEAVPVG